MPSVQISPLLMRAEELRSLLDAKGDQSPTVVIDCRFDLQRPEAGREAWMTGHIPGALYAHLDDDLASPRRADSGRHPLPDGKQFMAALGAWGIGPDTQVVAYDAAGGALAARLWWLLRWIGHGRVAVLDGGLPAWEAAGGELSSAVPAPAAAGPYPGRVGQMPVATTAEVVTALATEPPALLLDARDTARFAGRMEPIDARAGHVPGAINRPFQDNLDAAGCWRKPGELRAGFAELLPADQMAPVVMSMCGSGVTACHNLLALELSGLLAEWPDYPALYVGSWSEWITDPARPVGTAADA